MSKIGIFFGPAKGSVEKVAHIVAKELGETNCELLLVDASNFEKINQFDKIVLGISTVGRASWESTHHATGWETFMDYLSTIQLEGKTIAIYGLGDQVSYPENFADAIAWLYEHLLPTDAKIVGDCSADGYNFESSEAFKNNKFLGLPVDEDSEPEKTNERVANWVKKLKEQGF